MAAGSGRPRGALDRQVLACLAAAGRPITAGAVLSDLDGDLAYTTVMTTLTRLHTKGALGREVNSRAYAYSLAGDRADLDVLVRRTGCAGRSGPVRIMQDSSPGSSQTCHQGTRNCSPISSETDPAVPGALNDGVVDASSLGARRRHAGQWSQRGSARGAGYSPFAY